MKNRKNVLIVFAVLAILCLGIGYAALSDTLVINGTISGNSRNNSGSVVDEEQFDLQWTGTPTATPALPEGEDAATYNNLHAAASYTDPNGDATITVENMSIKGQTVVATFEIKNVDINGYMACLTADIEIEDNSYLICSYVFVEDANDSNCALNADGSSAVIKAGATVKIQVTIVMNETLIDVGSGNSIQEFSETIKVVITGDHVADSYVGTVGDYAW